MTNRHQSGLFGYLLYRFLYVVYSNLLRIFFSFNIFGVRNVPRTGGVILAVNHQSYLDPLTVGAGARRPCQFMARSTLFRNRLFGSIIRSLGTFPVGQGSADRGALREYIQRVRAGNAVLLFPEGTRTRDGLLGAIRPGVGMLGVRTGAPVVPTYIYGGFHIWPRQRTLPRQAKMSIYFGPLVRPEGLPGESKRDRQERIRSAVERVLRGLEARALATHGYY